MMKHTIGFTVETSRGPLWMAIVTGAKRQTIRKRRKKLIVPGDELALYWYQRDKATVPHLLMNAVCKEVRLVDGEDLWPDKDIAIRDGFGSLQEFRDWLIPPEERAELDGSQLRDRLRDMQFWVIVWVYPGSSLYVPPVPEAEPAAAARLEGNDVPEVIHVPAGDDPTLDQHVQDIREKRAPFYRADDVLVGPEVDPEVMKVIEEQQDETEAVEEKEDKVDAEPSTNQTE